MKAVFHRPRPQLPWATVLPDYSFPSGHAMNSFVVFVGVAVVIGLAHGRLAGAAAAGVAVLGAVLVGISRIYLGYHYPSDAVGGFAAAAAWLAIAWLVTKPLAATGRGSEAKR